jgi:hypothetical protein
MIAYNGLLTWFATLFDTEVGDQSYSRSNAYKEERSSQYCPNYHGTQGHRCSPSRFAGSKHAEASVASKESKEEE